MKKILLPLLVVFLFSAPAFSQVLKRLGDRAKQKMEQKAGEKMDKTIDNATDGKKKIKTEEGEVKEKGDGDEVKIKTESKNTSLKTYSKFDFVPGDKIVYAEDFAQDVIGEFPLKWNTNGTGEIVTVEGQPGKWLKMTEQTKYDAPYAKKLPDNYTVEFDLLMDFNYSVRVPVIKVWLHQQTPVTKNYYTGAALGISPGGGTGNSEGGISEDRIEFYNTDDKANNAFTAKDQLIGELTKNKKIPVHVAIWVQKERFRAWINAQKVYDLPKGMAMNLAPEKISFELDRGAANSYQYYLSNLKIAMATPDNRSKLITEGKWSTTGILFDANSDKIKPASYGTLKEIAAVLSENADVKVKIVGHTDSDGDDAKNLDLSKRRAASVRIALTTEFGIEGSRFETDGAGETKPVADNKTSEGKAQNRRVEFVKL